MGSAPKKGGLLSSFVRSIGVSVTGTQVSWQRQAGRPLCAAGVWGLGIRRGALHAATPADRPVPPAPPAAAGHAVMLESPRLVPVL